MYGVGVDVRCAKVSVQTDKKIDKPISHRKEREMQDTGLCGANILYCFVECQQFFKDSKTPVLKQYHGCSALGLRCYSFLFVFVLCVAVGYFALYDSLKNIFSMDSTQGESYNAKPPGVFHYPVKPRFGI